MDQSHYLDGLAQVIKYQQVIRQKKAGLGYGQGRGDLRQPLDIAHHIVAQIAHQAAPEAGQSRGGYGLILSQQPPQLLKGVGPGVHGLLLPAPLNGAAAALDLEQERGIEAQEAETAPFLPAFHTLQEIRTTVAPQLFVGRHRGLQVPQDLPVNRNQVALPGHLTEGNKIRINHALLHVAAD